MVIIMRLFILIDSFNNPLSILVIESVRPSIACSIAAILVLNAFFMTFKTPSLTICQIISADIACILCSASLG
ncbi:hypothetical protein CISIN_1g035121mg [Citrus sinensis]|uniref:Uncharacterized protein n=1 Tax=Citrus sinensis TaxID=2711 RepID=A0A067DLN9_CITSI|nr:hypothetical protein CISIN_1g035121mg [Citrus sinensis]